MAFIALPSLLLFASDVAAQDGVLVVPHGGVRALPQMTIERVGDQWSVSDLRAVEIFPAPENEHVVKDARVLPGGRILLSGIDDTDIGVSDPVTGEYTLLFRSENVFSSIESGVIAGYTPSGNLARVLYTDPSLSVAGIYDRTLEREIWRASLFVPGARALLVQAILMPGARIVTATNWRSIGVSGIDRFELAADPNTPSQVRMATAAHEGAPEELIIVPAFETLRDVMALDGETLLVTTRYKLLAIKLDGTIEWEFDTLDDPDIQGEFASARVLPSGRIAAATFEPGVWTSPHPNHRVHWFSAPEESSPPVRIASSQGLSRAPVRVTSAESTGGTGTAGYEAELGQANDGSPEQLQISERFGVAPDATRVGDRLQGRIVYQNSGETGVVLARLAVVAIPGNSCIPAGVEPRTLWERTDLLIGPGGDYAFNGEVVIDATFERGPWCAFIEMEDTQGNLYTQLEVNDIWEVTGEDGMETFPKLPGKDLSLVIGESPPMEPEPGMDMGGGPVYEVPDPDDDRRGCGCRQQGRPAGGGDGSLLILGAWMLGVCFRRRRARQ